MKKISYINGLLLIIIIIFFGVKDYQTNINLQKIEKQLINNYHNIYYHNLLEDNQKMSSLLSLYNTKLNAIPVKGYFSNLYETFIINKGEKDDLKKGMAIINKNRLIGFIDKVSNNYSTVMLLENFKQNVSIKINDNYGLLKIKNNKIIVTGIQKSKININDLVYTSGLTKVPGDIFIGKIAKIEDKDDTFETIMYIDVDKNYNYYEYLLAVQE